MSKLWVSVDGTRFVDAHGRHVILRGLNLGGDCKLPYPDGGTDRPSDFSNHAEVSFVGRPFPLAEADEHLGRITGWGFNVLRLLVTWEAVEHAGPGIHDHDYIEYVGRICERAQAHGLVVFIDFHQDAWSRMSGGSGAPGWTFAAMGLDFRRFGAAGAAHVMQYRYDYASPERRQEDRYPAMSWPVNYRMPANGIAWTAFFAGATLTPEWTVDGTNIQHYLQDRFFGSVRALARRLRDLPNVIGFDSLNEPGLGWIGHGLSERPAAPMPGDSSPVRLGPLWSPLDGLRVARGLPTTLPLLRRSPSGAAERHELTVNADGIPIWLPGANDPFERAGAWRLRGRDAEVLDEEFFRTRDGRRLAPEDDFMRPFFARMAQTVRDENPDWLLFAELSPYAIIQGRRFPKDMPASTVNASHWYDVDLLWSRRFPAELAPEQRQALLQRYGTQLAYLRSLGDRMGERSAPTLIGEFGVPYDLDDGESFERWASGERSADVWKPQAAALQLMYETLDALLLSSTQWNYTASNRNDARVGDGWNQEDLSVFSRDQQDTLVDSGGRAVEGFCRPYAQRTQGRLIEMRWLVDERRFVLRIDADASIDAPTEIYLPAAFGADIEARLSCPDARADMNRPQRLHVSAKRSGELRIEITVR